MSHLGRWLSAQVDGELDGVERDRVLNHLAGCDSCRQEATALRVLKRRMTALGDTASDNSIAGRLIERARSDQDLIAAPADSLPWSALPRSALPWSALPWSARARLTGGLGARRSWSSWQVATSSAGTALAAIGMLAFMLGGTSGEHPVPKVSPAVDSYWTQHSFDTTGQLPATGAQARQSAAPAALSPGAVRPKGFAALMRLDAP